MPRTLSRLLPLPLLAALWAGCAQAPVQQMSDARQAIDTARTSVTVPAHLEQLRAAEALLREAEVALEAGRYQAAREAAESARRTALEVRAKAADAGR
ncbi:MAG TPA: hypothetical protein VIX81_01200 [Gammaproteobacteria bacterium]